MSSEYLHDLSMQIDNQREITMKIIKNILEGSQLNRHEKQTFKRKLLGLFEDSIDEINKYNFEIVNIYHK